MLCSLERNALCSLQITNNAKSLNLFYLFHSPSSTPPSASFGYILNGFFVGWSSKFFSFDDESDDDDVSFYNQFQIGIFFSLSRLNTVTATHADDINFSYRFEKQFRRSQISWIISGFPLGIVIVSLLLYKSYYWIGTKFLLLSASILILLSWVLTMPFGLVF